MLRTKKILKYFKKEAFPTVFCPGCGITLATKTMVSAFAKLGLNYKNTAVISGIGCSARLSGYLAFDSFNSLHGRAIPIAEGLKTVRQKLNLVVFSGDGDLLSIGGNHLIHALHRQIKITVVMINNFIYGLTGGQTSPTTPYGIKTVTSPGGKLSQPIKAQSLVTVCQNFFYGRSTVFHLDHLEKVIFEALSWPSFSFVEVVCACPTHFFKKNEIKKPADVYFYFRDNFQIISENRALADNEIGIYKNIQKEI